MGTAEIFVCPSRHEGLLSIVMKTWKHECPIVATDSQGPGEVIENGVTGLLTPVNEVEPLADALNGLLSDKTQRDCLVQSAKSHYAMYYS